MRPERAAEAWQSERPGEAVGEGLASVAVDAPGLKGPCREDEAWHCEESPGKKSPVAAEDASVVEMPGPWDDPGQL